MSLAVVYARSREGINAPLVTVEVHLSNGLPSFAIVGLPETAVKESKDRVRGALINCQFEFPQQRITVNMAPADTPKEGGRFDLAIALGILAASGQIRKNGLDKMECLGELSLGGELRPVMGALPAAIQAKQAKRQLILPRENAAEAALAGDVEVIPAAHLLEVAAHLNGQKRIEFQPEAPPGTGKSMLASRLPGILPLLSEAEALESAAVASVSDLAFDPRRWREPPFRSPHHTASAPAMVGGGGNPRPGEISLAHNGVLFLDELPNFQFCQSN